MKTIRITQMHLSSLHVNTTYDVIIHNYENVKAVMNISYGQKERFKTLFYQISVEEENRRLYSLKCEFHYLCEDDEDERQMVMQAIEMVSPCLEELIAFMTLQIYPKTN